MTEVDDRFAAARRGDSAAFADWMGRVERPIRLSLRAFARAVDVEAVVQETLMRMWVFATDPGARVLAGDNASLRFAIGVARNVARSEARRHRRQQFLPPDELPEVSVAPDLPPDPGLRKAIDECMKRVAGRPLEALMARLGPLAEQGDRWIAESLGMTVNTFLQNVVRARRQFARCLEGKGVPLSEILT